MAIIREVERTAIEKVKPETIKTIYYDPYHKWPTLDNVKSSASGLNTRPFTLQRYGNIIYMVALEPALEPFRRNRLAGLIADVPRVDMDQISRS